MRLVCFAFSLVFLVSGCSKTPESETAKKIGEQPKQIVDKVTTDVNKALQKGMEQRQEAEKKD
ncbi:MAG TPA: hypothetical protein VMU46_04095 [Burkholderiales bacterium]|nr:hypothetical protein [Burkholderiales bacterium]